MAEEVTVVVTDSNPPGDLINNVYVGLHDNTTKALLQFDLTGNGALDDGEVIFSNVTPGTYEIRVVPADPVTVVDGKIQTITVLDAPVAPLSNIFDVEIEQPGFDTASNANLCRCSGYFVDSTGRARPNLSIHITDGNLPQLEYVDGQTVDAKGVVPSRLIATTDSDGFVSIDLYRDQYYGVYMEGWENLFRQIVIPDASSANIVDVIFPYVASVKFYDGGNLITPITAPTISIAALATKELTFKVFLRNGIEAEPSEVRFGIEDTTIIDAEASYADQTLTIEGLLAGSTSVKVYRTCTDDCIRAYPEPTLIADLAVTVTP